MDEVASWQTRSAQDHTIGIARKQHSKTWLFDSRPFWWLRVLPPCALRVHSELFWRVESRKGTWNTTRNSSQTLCNCDCKTLTTAICSGLHQFSVNCIHPAQRRVCRRQMTDNIFEIETCALAQCICMPRDSGIYGRILHVLIRVLTIGVSFGYLTRQAFLLFDKDSSR